MDYIPYLLLVILICLLTLNFLSFQSKKTAIELVNEMGIGYNLGNTYNCCIISEEDNIKSQQINNWGTILPTKKQINQIKKYGFKTIRFQVVYNNLISESEEFKSNWIKELKKIIDWIYNLNMYCILSIYHNDDFWNSEEIKAIDKYINFWKDIANEFKNYDDYLIFESNHKLYFINITLLNVSQSFIDVIRNSGGLNTKRLLIIPKMSIELEYYRISDDFPNDPSNKTAISIRYYFPSLYGGEYIYDDDYGEYYIYDEDEIVWYDYTGSMLVSTPLNN
jgi:endoglucanase